MGRAFEYRKATKLKRWGHMAKTFTRLGKQIAIAVKAGGPEPENNPSLRSIIATCKRENMPKDNIERAIKKAAGGDGENYDEVRYEGYGPGGAAVIVEALTDNRNRTASAVRSYFTKSGGAMGESNSVSFMFNRVGEVSYPPEAGDADKVMEAAIEAGADDVISDENGHTILCAFDALNEVSKALEAALGAPASAKPVWRPTTTAPLDEEKAASMMRLMEALDNDDDVQNVFANFEIADDIMAKLSA